VDSVATPPRRRRATKPTAASRRRRLEAKTLRGEVKQLRKPVVE
jgi:ribosome-associated protein